MSEITLKINGNEEKMAIGITVADILVKYNLDPEAVVVEVNEDIRLKDVWNKPLVDGDTLELVRFVGGG